MQQTLSLKLVQISTDKIHKRNENGINCIYVSSKNFESPNSINEQDLIAIAEVDGVEKIFKVKLDDSVPEGTVEYNAIIAGYIDNEAYRPDPDKSSATKLDFHFRDQIPASREAESIDVTISLLDPLKYIKRIYTKKNHAKIALDHKKLQEKVRENLPNYLLNDDYKCIVPIKNEFFPEIDAKYIYFECKITGVKATGKQKLIKIEPTTNINVTLKKYSVTADYFKINGYDAEDLLKNIEYNWEKLGVGGLKEQIKQIIDQIFLPRRMPLEDLKRYGSKFAKGVLLYGPPGTGKTLIVRKIAELFTKKDNITIIEGSELKSKWVGESGANLRKIFKKAEEEWQEKGEKSDLHIIIIDEIEALTPKRNSRSDNTGVDHDLITTLLTKLDGAKMQNNNIAVFGLTNRKDMIDEAILRPGRLGLHIEIGLPKEEEREQILLIHTKELRGSSLLGKDVDLKFFAKETENWSGAELADLVIRARNLAIANNFITDTETNKITYKKDGNLAVVNKEHFLAAFKCINPQHKGNIEKLNELLKNPFNLYSNKLQQDFASIKKDVNALNTTGFCSMAIFGPAGVGKTSFAANVAKGVNAPCIEILQAKDLCMHSERNKYAIIDEAFERAAKSKFSVVVLDDLEGILGVSKDGYPASQQLKIYLENKFNTTKMENGNKLLIITTCKDQKLFCKLFGRNSYQAKITLTKIGNITDLVSLLKSFNIKVVNLDKLGEIVPRSSKKWLYNVKKFLTINNIKPEAGLDLKAFLQATNSLVPPGTYNNLPQLNNNQTQHEDDKSMYDSDDEDNRKAPPPRMYT